jgi:hypothetical protein
MAGLSTCGELDTRRYTFGVINLPLDIDTGEDDALVIL